MSELLPRPIRPVLFLLVAWLVAAAAVHAQPAAGSPTAVRTGATTMAPPSPRPGSTASEDQAVAIAKELNCPLCQGYSLLDCPLEVCAQMREIIRTRLAAGESRDQIVAAFVRDYGPQVLAAPPTRGFFLAAWVLPSLILAMGFAAGLAYLRRGIRRAAMGATADGAAPSGLDSVRYAEDVERLVRRDA